MDPLAILAAALSTAFASGAGLVWEAARNWLARRYERGPQGTDDRIRQRVAELSAALTASGRNLTDAAAMLGDLQTEMTARMTALEELRRQIAANEELRKVSAAATEALDEIIEARMRQQERRITKLSWLQGALFAVFGASVAILVVVFSHFLPTIK
jgi:chromosome segregation ATPase